MVNLFSVRDMHNLLELMVERLSAGLRRKSLTTCSRWAESYRVMGGKDFPGPWRFKYHPWLREMHDSTAPLNVGKKAAQLGYTEAVLNRTFFKIDVEQVDCLYVLPARTPDASDFSASRFDSALELSPHLAKLFSNVKNVGHKRAGNTNLYIRGSKARGGLKSIPVGFLVLDEVDEMTQKNIPLARERQSGQMTRECWAISTPTIENYGIDELFKNTTSEHFFFRCPACSRHTELIFPDCLEAMGDDVNDPRVRESRLICKECRATLDHETKCDWLADAKWVPGHTDRDDRGFYCNQLYSSADACKPAEIAKAVIKAQYNPAEEQELWNSKMGLAHTVDGAKISDVMIDSCIASHRCGVTRSNKLITMGVDVGKWLHYEIDEWTTPPYATNDLNIESRPRVIAIKKCLHFEELDQLMREFRINFCVIDANPERRKAFEFATRFWGHVKMCFYGRGVLGKQINIKNDEDGEPTITVDRTSWIDLALGRIRSGHIALPMDTPMEYRQHIKSLVRIYEKDADDNPVGRYIHGNEDDHYAHARTYAEIALPLGAGLNISHDITESPI